MTTLKNIWVAAGDGDLDAVTAHIQLHCMSFSAQPPHFQPFDNQNLHIALSPNVPDPNTYTPMHAAASYGHIHILQYLISQGGDVNITDEDGDTPLYTVENLETARFLVEHGAIIARQNNQGISPIVHLSEEYPQIADYLRQSLDPSTAAIYSAPTQGLEPSQYSQNVASEELTSGLMSSVRLIVERAQAEGREPDEEQLRQAVGRTVLDGIITGYSLVADSDQLDHRPIDPADENVSKKRRDNPE